MALKSRPYSNDELARVRRVLTLPGLSTADLYEMARDLLATVDARDATIQGLRSAEDSLVHAVYNSEYYKRRYGDVG